MLNAVNEWTNATPARFGILFPMEHLYTASGSVGHKQYWTTQVYIPFFKTRFFTLVWNREMVGASVIKGFSDLDLAIVCPHAADYSSTGRQNVEKVSMTGLGQYCTLRVYGYNVPSNIGTQSFRVVGLTV